MRRSLVLAPFAVATIALAVAAACGPAAPPLTSGPPPTSTGAPKPRASDPASSAKVTKVSLESVGLDPAALDKKADPCIDFYEFACGSWLKNTPIPGDESRWSRSFNEINKRNEAELKRILEDAAAKKGPDPIRAKIGAFYAACMDEAAVDAAGAKPIQKLLDKAGRVTNVTSVAALVTELHAQGITPLFDVGPWQDFKDATKWDANLDQGGIGLPDRDYYTEEKHAKVRADYLAHVERMFALIGVKGAAAKVAAADVLAFETELAKIAKTKVERRDPKGLYNKVDRAGVAKLAPSFPWDAYWKGLGFPDVKDVNVTSVAYFEGLDKLLKSTKPATFRNYLKWTIVRETTPLLSKAFVDEKFSFDKALTGQKEQRPRWRRCVAKTDEALGELLAQPYIEANFAGDSKKAAEDMVAAIGRAFAVSVGKLKWMDQPTREKALAKLKSMAYLIGYPSKWKSYDFAVDEKAHAKNVLTAAAFEMKRELAKIGKKVERDEWQMTPPVVNAYYDPQRNHMVFPAGILQPPFYSVKSSVVVNLGAIGMVVGHELTHGFDDEGSQFDADGNLVNWWSEAVGKEFERKTTCVADQYAKYEPLPGLKINGKLTLGENIADLGGLKLAFAAYRDLRKGSAEVLSADGFSEDQQFFLAYGQGWCSKMTDELAKVRIATDPHSPPKYRVNGVVANMPEFGDAFQCPAGSPMRPKKTCEVW